MKRLTMKVAKATVLEICPTARAFGAGPVGFLTWHVFDSANNQMLASARSEKGSWCRALAKLERSRRRRNG